MRFQKRFWIAAFTLAGTTIGAGILGLPYVFSRSGFFVGLFWIIVIGIITAFSNLCLAEVSLRTKTTHQIPGYAEKYLGKKGRNLMSFAVMFGIYSALIAYLIGVGQSLSQLFFGNISHSFYFAILFWIIMAIFLREGFGELKRVESWGVISIIVIILAMFILFFNRINPSNFNHYDFSHLFLPFGVVLFALMGFTAIPELRREVKGNEKILKKSIIAGMIISVLSYILFSLVFVGVLGRNVEQVSTLSFGNIIIILGIFTMLTSYLVLSFVIKDIFQFDIGKSSRKSFYLAAFTPLILYIIIIFLHFFDFTGILNVGGVISGGLTGILILLMNLKAKKMGDRKSELNVKNNWFITILISIIFLLGVISLI